MSKTMVAWTREVREDMTSVVSARLIGVIGNGHGVIEHLGQFFEVPLSELKYVDHKKVSRELQKIHQGYTLERQAVDIVAEIEGIYRSRHRVGAILDNLETRDRECLQESVEEVILDALRYVKEHS